MEIVVGTSQVAQALPLCAPGMIQMPCLLGSVSFLLLEAKGMELWKELLSEIEEVVEDDACSACNVSCAGFDLHCIWLAPRMSWTVLNGRSLQHTAYSMGDISNRSSSLRVLGATSTSCWITLDGGALWGDFFRLWMYFASMSLYDTKSKWRGVRAS